MGQRAVGVTDTASGSGVADVRARERTVDSATVCEQYVIPIRERVPAFIGGAATFRAIGTAAAAPHWLFQMGHASGSGRLVIVRQLAWSMDQTAALTTVAQIGSLCRATGTAAGGTALTKASVGIGTDTADTSASQVTLLGATASDGGAATAITGLTVANRMWRAFGMRLHSAVGPIFGTAKELVPPALRDHGIVLRAGEQLAVAAEYGAATDNPTTAHHIVSVLWEEYTLP